MHPLLQAAGFHVRKLGGLARGPGGFALGLKHPVHLVVAVG
jgi:hypothetical protein